MDSVFFYSGNPVTDNSKTGDLYNIRVVLKGSYLYHYFLNCFRQQPLCISTEGFCPIRMKALNISAPLFTTINLGNTEQGLRDMEW